MGRRKNRKHSIIDELDPALKEAVEQMLLRGSTYSEIVDFLKENGVGISVASICRYAKNFNANLETLNIAQENFRRMMDELDRYPDLDTTEAIIRLTSQHLFDALAQRDPGEWQNVSVEKMLKETNGLIRAAAYKKRIEIQNQDSLESGKSTSGDSFGLGNIAQRLKLLYADQYRMQIESIPGRFTAVVIRIPLRDFEEDGV